MLRERYGMAYNVESNVTFYTDTGLFAIYFTSDLKNKDKCISLINKEIDKVKEIELTPMQLSLAKRQWKGQLGIASESRENNALTMAKYYLHFNRYISLDELFSEIDAITSKQIKDVANKIFSFPMFELRYL